MHSRLISNVCQGEVWKVAVGCTCLLCHKHSLNDGCQVLYFFTPWGGKWDSVGVAKARILSDGQHSPGPESLSHLSWKSPDFSAGQVLWPAFSFKQQTAQPRLGC